MTVSVSEPNHNRNYVPYPDNRGLSVLLEDKGNGICSDFPVSLALVSCSKM